MGRALSGRLAMLALGSLALLGGVDAQSVELTPPFARGNLHRGSAALTSDGRWVVFAGRYEAFGPGINSLYAVASDAGSEPFLLYDHGDIPGVAREFDPGTVTFVHVTSDSRWAVFTVDERGSIYSARLSGAPGALPWPPSPDPFRRLAQADSSRDFQLSPDGRRAVFHGPAGLHVVPVNGSAPAVELVSEEPAGGRVGSFAIDATSTWVVFTLGDDGDPLQRRLFCVPIDGRASPRLLSPHRLRLAPGTPPVVGPGETLGSLDVSDYQLAPDGSSVLFLLQETHGDCALGCSLVAHLYLAPTEGSAPARRLASGDVRLAAFAPDSRHVVYRRAPPEGGPAVLYAHPLEGGEPPRRLHEPADAVAGLAVLQDLVLFLESPAAGGGDRLWRVPIDGTRRARALGDALPAGRTIREFRASPDGERFVYSADADVPGVFTLFAGPLEVERVRQVGGPPPEGHRAIGASADVARFVFTPDSSAVLAHVADPAGLALERVGLDGSVRRLSGAEGASDLVLDDAGRVAAYRGAREHDTRLHVYAVPADGSSSPVQLDDFGPRLGSLSRYELHPNGREAVFAAGSRDWSFPEVHRVPLDLSAPPRLLAGLVQGEENLIDFRVEPLRGWLVYALQVPDAFVYRTQLYGAPLDLSAPRVRLDQGEARVLEHRLAGERALYRKDTDPPREHFELFSVPVDGTDSPRVLNGPMPVHDGRVYDYAVSPDGGRVVYVAAQDAPNRPEIFSVPADGGQAPVRLNPPPVAGGEVRRGPPSITPDGTRVVFVGDLALNGAHGLWVASLAGGAPAQALWSPSAGREVERFEVTSDSARVVFTADGVVNGRHQLHVVPVDGSAPAATLPATAGAPRVVELVLSADGTRAAYVAEGPLVASVRLDGSAGPAILSSPLVAGGRVLGAPVVTDGWVLYQADQEEQGRYDLYVAPIDGHAAARRVDTPSPSHRPLSSYAIAGDEVLFLSPVTRELLRWPLDGSRPARPLNLPGTTVRVPAPPVGFRLHPDGRRVLFAAGTSTTGLHLGWLGRPARAAALR